MPGGLGARFALEAAFIVGVAVVTVVASFRWQAILVTMLLAWVLVALVEWATSRRRPTRASEPSSAQPTPQPTVEASPSVPAEAERPQHVHVVAREAEAETERQPFRAVPTPQLPPPPPPAPRPPPPPPPKPAVVSLASVDTRPREWNLWELERAVRDNPGADRDRDAERSYLLMYLREFANSRGVIPMDFDRLVRDSFGDVLASVQPQ